MEIVQKVKETAQKISNVANQACRRVMAKTKTILDDQSGASAVEIAGAAVMAIVLICILINAFSGIFSNTIIPGIQDKIKGMFSMV